MHEVKVAIRLPDASVIFLTLNSTRDLIPTQTIGSKVPPGSDMHRHVKVDRLSHPDLTSEELFRVGEYLFDRPQAEILISRLFTLLYGVK